VASPTETPTRVLVIEDSETVLAEIEGILEANGFEVITASDGRMGLWRLWGGLPDLILCDLMMPEMDGFEVLEALRERPEWATIPFVCLTARTERQAMRRAMEMGADDYVTKPVTARELVSAVTAGLHKRARIENEASERLGDLRRSITLALPHEFRTPLSIILGYSELLVDEAEQRVDEELKSIATSVSAAAAQLHRLTENFLLYAQLELTARAEGQRGPFDVDKPAALHLVAEAVAQDCAANLRRTSDIECDLEPVALYLREDILRKVVTELVDNAFKFSEPGKKVRVITRQDCGRGSLTIADQGMGMVEQEIASLGAYLQFDRVVREQQGMGLGLGIVRRVAEICGGELTIESEPDRGTAVSLHLPTGLVPR
jgi:signal transduction histidine kinase